MATAGKKAAESALGKPEDFKKIRLGIVVAEWNDRITAALLKGAYELLLKAGVKEKNIHILSVPGSFELPLGCQHLAKEKDMDAVLALGCVIQGETRHFDFICSAVAHGIIEVGLRYHKPVVFGVLTTDNLKQAKERSGGKHGNKGAEAAETALKMLLAFKAG